MLVENKYFLKTLLLLVLVTSLIGVATSNVTHEVFLGENFEQVSTNITLTSDRPTTRWTTTWTVPENAFDIRVKDSYDEIRDFRHEDNTLRFSTNLGQMRTSEKVEIQYRVNVSEEKAEGLKKSSLQLPGMPNETTQVSLETDTKILSTTSQQPFKTKINKTEAVYQGEGPLNILTTYISDEEVLEQNPYENYILFGEANLTEIDEAYYLITNKTGVTPQFNSLTVIIKEDASFEQKFGPRPSGVHRAPSLIYVKGSEVDKTNLPGLLAHETAHAINHEYLGWRNIDTTVLDEGIATYIEDTVNQELDIHTQESFGKPVTWEQPCEDDPSSNCRYRIEPRGTPEDLWEYYSTNRTFMEEWTPRLEGRLNPDMDKGTFGYSYSNLLIRNYVKESSSENLQDIYRQLEDLETAQTSEEYVEKVEEVLGTFKPCHKESENEVYNCTRELNSMELPIPEDAEPLQSGRDFEVQSREEIHSTQNLTDNGQEAVVDDDITFDRVVIGILQTFEHLIEDVKYIFSEVFNMD